LKSPLLLNYNGFLSALSFEKTLSLKCYVKAIVNPSKIMVQKTMGAIRVRIKLKNAINRILVKRGSLAPRHLREVDAKISN
jgi:hypothetical protein